MNKEESRSQWNKIYSGLMRSPEQPLSWELIYADSSIIYGRIGRAQGEVLDNGCGTLKNLWTFFREYGVDPPLHLTGVDFSKEALKKAESFKDCIEREFPATVDLLLRDSTDLQLPDNTFDKVVSIETPQYWGSEIKKGIGEMIRVCKPDGRMVLTLRHPDYLRPQDPSRILSSKVPKIEGNMATYDDETELAVFNEEDAEVLLRYFKLEPKITVLTSENLGIKVNEFGEKIPSNTKTSVLVKCKK